MSKSLEAFSLPSAQSFPFLLEKLNHQEKKRSSYCILMFALKLCIFTDKISKTHNTQWTFCSLFKKIFIMIMILSNHSIKFCTYFIKNIQNTYE